uniref:Uncharacterized protein MANES_01G063000 n=1 Tax=Rhizophora mucronata TaxID=61149 RepID=A0A2P2K0W7_RHIMU
MYWLSPPFFFSLTMGRNFFFFLIFYNWCPVVGWLFKFLLASECSFGVDHSSISSTFYTLVVA